MSADQKHEHHHEHKHHHHPEPKPKLTPEEAKAANNLLGVAGAKGIPDCSPRPEPHTPIAVELIEPQLGSHRKASVAIESQLLDCCRYYSERTPSQLEEDKRRQAAAAPEVPSPPKK